MIELAELTRSLEYATAVVVVGTNPDRPVANVRIFSLRGGCTCGECFDVVPPETVARMLRRAADEYERATRSPQTPGAAGPYPAPDHRGPGGDAGASTKPH